MALQCSFVKQALLAAGLLLSLAHGARRGSQQPAAAISPSAAEAAGRHESHPLPQHLRAVSTAPVVEAGDVPEAGLAAVPKAHSGAMTPSQAASLPGGPPAQASTFVAKRQDPDHPEESERIMDAITRMKVETCVDLKEAHGQDFGQFEHCLDLLKDVCHPGKDGRMDGDGRETPTGEGFCKAYFHNAKRIAEESAKKCLKAVKNGTDSEEYQKCLPFMRKLCHPGDDMMHGGKKETPTGEGYCQKFFPTKDEKKKEPEKEGNSSSEGEDRGKNMTNTSTGAKDSGNAGDGGAGEKDAAGWHMKETEKVPEQGFEGKKVAHDDQETITDDWRKEYGPEHPSYSEVEEICKNNPSNKWCERLMSQRMQQKQHQKQHQRSGAAKVRSPALALALAVLLRAAA